MSSLFNHIETAKPSFFVSYETNNEVVKELVLKIPVNQDPDGYYIITKTRLILYYNLGIPILRT